MKVFVGYPSEHRREATEVADFIEQQGHEVWIDYRNLVGGDLWDAERLHAHRKADFIVHLCSSALVTRGGPVARELRETLRLLEDRPFGTNLAVCLRLEDMRLPIELMSLHYIDMFRGNWRLDLTRALTKTNLQLLDRSGQRPMQQMLKQVGERTVKFQTIEIKDSLEYLDLTQSFVQYESDEVYWKYINAVVMSEVMAPSFWAKAMLNNAPVDELGRDNPSWSKSVAEEFFRSGEIASIRIYNHWYGSGAAHANHSIGCANFLGNQFGRVGIQALLGHQADVAHKLLKICFENIIEVNSDGDIKIEPLNSLPELESDIWGNLSCFNFDKVGITFSFSPYQVLAYAFGPQEVQIPWSVAMECVSQAYQPCLMSIANQA